MSLQINLLKKEERRFQGIVSMKVMALGSAGLLTGVMIFVLTLAGISKMTLRANLERGRNEFKSINPRAEQLRKAQAAIATNQKTLAEFDRREAGDRPPMHVVLRSVQEQLPAQLALSHFFAGIEASKESKTVNYALRISGTAEGELTAVAAKRLLNADEALHRFCGEIRLASSQRYSGETWAFAIEGSRPAEGAKK